MAAVAVAACIMLVAGVLAVMHREEARRPDAAAGVAQMAVQQPASEGEYEAQIAQDNKLLMAVDVALRDEGPSPVEEYALQRIAAAHAKAGAAGGAPAAKEGKATNQ
jgi:hypothetical protein